MGTPDMSEILSELANIKGELKSGRELDTERRKTDDARYDRLQKNQEIIIQRTDKHGMRTTALETQWGAFFSDQGAFKIVLKNVEEQGRKVDKLSWFIAIGIGLLAALQFLVPLWIKK